jgi:signal transduction histidine kinase
MRLIMGREDRSKPDPGRPRRWDPGAALDEDRAVPEGGWEDLDRLKERAQRLGLHREVREVERVLRRSRRRERTDRLLTPEERVYHEATRRAEHKIKFVQHVISYCCVVGFLAFLGIFVPFFRFAALATGFGWGIGLTSHFFQAMVAPTLRKRWISSEVDRQVQKTVTRERRSLEEEKLRSLEELSASIAHEIRNPITAAKSLVQQMGEDPSSSENVEYAKVALEELDRVERSISHLLRYAREEEMQVRSLRLAEVVESALETLRERIEKTKVTLTRDLASDGEMEGDADKLRRVAINLVGNALDALEEAGTPSPRIDVSLGENLAGNEVWLRVRDNGPGFDEETQKKIFRPFFTSKANGTGLGLAITRKLVDAHGGSIEVTSAPGQGAEFLVILPRNGNGAVAG